MKIIGFKNINENILQYIVVYKHSHFYKNNLYMLKIKKTYRVSGNCYTYRIDSNVYFMLELNRKEINNYLSK